MNLSLVIVAFLVGVCPTLVTSAPPLDSWWLRGGSRILHQELAKFHGKVDKYLPQQSQDYPPHGDRFLLRFLDPRDETEVINLEKAKTSLKQYFSWRKAEHVDGILDAPCSTMEERYPYAIRGFTHYADYWGSANLALYIHLGKWDLTEVEESSESERKRLVRYVTVKMMEDINFQTLRGDDGYPYQLEPSRFSIVINMKGYNEDGMGCLERNPLLEDIIQALAAQWSEAIDGIYLVNAPELPPCVLESISQFQLKTAIDVKVRRDEVIRWDPLHSGGARCLLACDEGPREFTVFDNPFGDTRRGGEECFPGCDLFNESSQKGKYYSCKSDK